MSERIYDHEIFVGSMESWVEEASDRDLDRAWRITKGCLAVHAVVDRLSTQTGKEAADMAWDDFVVAYNGGEATYFMAALAEDFRVAAPPGLDEPMIVAVERAYRAASHNPSRRSAKRASRGEGPFTLIEGGQS